MQSQQQSAVRPSSTMARALEHVEGSKVGTDICAWPCMYPAPELLHSFWSAFATSACLMR